MVDQDTIIVVSQNNNGDIIYTHEFEQYKSQQGNFVIIKHSDRLETLYEHLSKRAVSVGNKISKKGAVDNVGTTGRSIGIHLYFEIRITE